jgi:hypothetical protein
MPLMVGLGPPPFAKTFRAARGEYFAARLTRLPDRWKAGASASGTNDFCRGFSSFRSLQSCHKHSIRARILRGFPESGPEAKIDQLRRFAELSTLPQLQRRPINSSPERDGRSTLLAGNIALTLLPLDQRHRAVRTDYPDTVARASDLRGLTLS